MNRSEEVPHIRSILRHGYNETFILWMWDVALEYLPPAVIAKVPPPYFSDDIRAAYQAIGKNLEWNLTIPDSGDTGAYAFFYAAGRAGLTQGQQNAAALLFALTEALEENALSDRVKQNILDAYAGLDSDALILGIDYKKIQKKKAQKPRSIIPEIKEDLVRNYPDYTAKELWPHLYAELRERGLDPEETDAGYKYDHKDGDKTITFNSFANIKKINKSR